MKILILSNSSVGIWQFRRELVQRLLEVKHSVYLSVPREQYFDEFEKLGVHCIETRISRHGVNPFADFRLFLNYLSMIRKIKPDIVFSYTIKPNVYGGMACQACKVPYLANVTGLGTAIQNGGLLQKISLMLYKMGLKGAKRVFFQNSENHRFMVDKGIVSAPTTILPGSGVNLEHFAYEDYPSDENGIRFLFVGRIMRDKGICELLEAARAIKGEYSNVAFDVVGGYDGAFETIIRNAHDEGIIKYHGMQNDVRPFYRACHCVVLPSYHEGMANVLLEGAATGRPLIATNIPGCREIFEQDVTGFGCEARNAESLYAAVKKFIGLPSGIRITMGKKARERMEQHFSRDIVIGKYLLECENM